MPQYYYSMSNRDNHSTDSADSGVVQVEIVGVRVNRLMRRVMDHDHRQQRNRLDAVMLLRYHSSISRLECWWMASNSSWSLWEEESNSSDSHQMVH